MKLLAYGPLVGVSLLLASDLNSIMPDMASQVLQGGALAVLAWTVWYMLARAFPAHTKALRDQRNDFLKVLKEDQEARIEYHRQFQEDFK